MVVLAAGLLLFLLIVAGLLLVRLSKPLERRQRLVLVVVALLAMAYFLPKVIQSAVQGYRTGLEIRQRQGR